VYKSHFHVLDDKDNNDNKAVGVARSFQGFNFTGSF
jgi:hypothetical protein